MENKIRVKNKDLYVIEVNDAGDTISFDVTDIELPFRLERAKKMAEDAMKWLNLQKPIIAKKPERIAKGNLLSERDRAMLNTYKELYKKLRAAIDEFCGVGAADKIFGSQNYLEMFNDFIEQMQPHIDAMGVKSVDIKKRIEEKYNAPTEDEI